MMHEETLLQQPQNACTCEYTFVKRAKTIPKYKNTRCMKNGERSNNLVCLYWSIPSLSIIGFLNVFASYFNLNL